MLTQLFAIFISILFAVIILRLISPYLRSIIDGIVGAERGKDFVSLISFVIISGSIVKGIESGRVFSVRVLRISLIRILNNYLDLTLNVVKDSLSFIVVILSVALVVIFLGGLIIQNKKVL